MPLSAGLGTRYPHEPKLTVFVPQTFPARTEGSVKKHWYKDMHYAEFAEDEVCGASTPEMTFSQRANREIMQSAALMSAIKEYENNKWKVIGQKVGKPAKACEQYAKEHFPGRHPPDKKAQQTSRTPARVSLPATWFVLDSGTGLTHFVRRSLQPCEAWLGAVAINTNRGEESQGAWKEFCTRQGAPATGPEPTSSSTPFTCLFKSI